MIFCIASITFKKRSGKSFLTKSYVMSVYRKLGRSTMKKVVQVEEVVKCVMDNTQ